MRVDARFSWRRSVLLRFSRCCYVLESQVVSLVRGGGGVLAGGRRASLELVQSQRCTHTARSSRASNEKVHPHTHIDTDTHGYKHTHTRMHPASGDCSRLMIRRIILTSIWITNVCCQQFGTLQQVAVDVKRVVCVCFFNYIYIFLCSDYIIKCR